MQVFDCLDEETRPQGIAAAVSAIFSQKLIVMPTDTSYALAGYAFGEAPATAIRTAKAIGETTPLQVLIGDKQVLDGISMQAPEHARMLADAFWPGPMTLIVPASPSLRWHVGGDERYVQVRVPDQEVAIELLLGFQFQMGTQFALQILLALLSLPPAHFSVPRRAT